MAVPYNLNVPHNHLKGFFSILFRWHGSVWKAILFPLLVWLTAFYIIFFIYHFILRPSDKLIFDAVTNMLEVRIETFIPMTFILGFFVSSVFGRWQKWLKNIGGFESTAAAIATYIIGADENTRAIRRTIIRYLVLSQTLVLRNVSVQVRRRFPTLEAIEAANFMTSEERALLEEINDEYTKFWIPTIWAENIICEARQNGKILSDPITANISSRIDKFRRQLKNMIIFDWIPIPLVYPQLVTFCVRFYFIICLFTRQISRSKHQNLQELSFLWIPVTTIMEFVVYMGWLKVAESMLHPLGETFGGNFDCNQIIDQNLITGLSIIDCGGGKLFPKPKKDAFWDTKVIAPLYTYETANRHVYPMTGTASHVNFVKNVEKIFMIPHSSRLINMSQEEKENLFKTVDVGNYNNAQKQKKQQQNNIDKNKILNKLKKIAEKDDSFKKSTFIDKIMLKL